MCGNIKLTTDRIRMKELEWLGHLVRMPDNRLPKSVLFGWLPEPQPRCGPRKQWRDVLRQDLKFIDVAEADWYEESRKSRTDWRALYHSGIDHEAHQEVTQTACGPSMVKTVTCTVCGRSFRRESDRKRQKCLDERRKPVSEQRGAVQCQNCHRWLRIDSP